MTPDSRYELYQQVILEHNKRPRNFQELPDATHSAEGYNPLCGDHLHVYLKLKGDVVQEVTFKGDGCAISKASASMMTTSLKGKTIAEANRLFAEFHQLLLGELQPGIHDHHLDKLTIFSNIWHFPARVKCASLAWHTMKGAMDQKKTVSTE